MKHILYTSALLFLLTLLVTSLNAQVLVNKAWSDTTGGPQDSLSLLMGAIDGTNYVTVGNSYATGDCYVEKQ
jgi:hypothetical protein